jgi:hypothetical protein
MLGGLLILFITGAISFAVIAALKRQGLMGNTDEGILQRLFFYHALLTVAYYLYAIASGSDSEFYYRKVMINYRGDTWGDFYGTSTMFIEFIGYPFIKFFSFSYEAVMALFSFFGFLGFIYFYIFFKENIRLKHRFFGMDLLTLTFFLPNLHFWSASFGKGSLIFLGIGLYFFGLSKIKNRIPALVIGAVIIYMVRPHILLVMLVSSVMGFMFSSRGVPISLKIGFLAVASVAFFFIYQDVLSLVGIDEQEFISQGLDLTHRASELSKAASGIDISQYNLFFQVFTFLYRPLFFDAPGILGLIVSFENVFYLLITLKILSFRGLKFLWNADNFVKTAFFSLLSVSIALAQISGNLGLAMRQKSQIMILLLFIVMKYMDESKVASLRQQWLLRKKRERMNAAHYPSNP